MAATNSSLNIVGGLKFQKEFGYYQLAEDFRQYHSNDVNVGLHLITTPLCFIAVACLVANVTRRAFLFDFGAFAYFVSLIDKVPIQQLFVVALMLISIRLTAARLNLGFWISLVVFGISYFMQDVAHWITNESTFQSTYEQKSDFLAHLVEHTYFLLPLCVDAASACLTRHTGFQFDWSYLSPESYGTAVGFCFLAVWVYGNYYIDSTGRFLPFQFRQNRVVSAHLGTPKYQNALESIRAWTIKQGPSDTNSSHWWYRNLTGAPREAFDAIARSQAIADAFGEKFDPETFCVDVLEGMNEIYVSGPNAKGTSDEVFYTKHIDGPYWVFPFASCYRAIVGLDMNTEFSTHFPMLPDSITLSKGDVYAFDFNREIHYITRDLERPNTTFRVVLKIHYCTYPRSFYYLGKLLGFLNTKYNEVFRALFLKTIRPKTTVEDIMAFFVVQVTKAVYLMEELIGWSNLPFYFSVGYLAYCLQSYSVFLYATSFLHYLRYIHTYYRRDDIAYGDFKRDAFLFKAISIGQLFYLYASPYIFGDTHVPSSSISIMLIVLGYFVSMAATRALGIDGTYFGIELGMIEADYGFVKTFPYNVLPHPMILGQVVALIGLNWVPHVSEVYPYLVPIHISLYLVHMLQEIYDIHRGRPWYWQEPEHVKQQ